MLMIMAKEKQTKWNKATC